MPAPIRCKPVVIGNFFRKVILSAWSSRPIFDVSTAAPTQVRAACGLYEIQTRYNGPAAVSAGAPTYPVSLWFKFVPFSNYGAHHTISTLWSKFSPTACGAPADIVRAVYTVSVRRSLPLCPYSHTPRLKIYQRSAFTFICSVSCTAGVADRSVTGHRSTRRRVERSSRARPGPSHSAKPKSRKLAISSRITSKASRMP